MARRLNQTRKRQPKAAEKTAPARKPVGRKAQILDFGLRGIWVSLRQFCHETGRAVETTTKRISDAKLAPEMGPSGEALYRLRDLLDAVIFRDETGNMNPDTLDPFRRKAYYASALDQLRLKENAGELIPKLEVEAETSHVMKTVAQFFDTLPDVLERDCGLGAEVLVTLERRLDAVREDLFAALSAEPPGDATRLRESA